MKGFPLKYPTTSKTLLERIAEGDEVSWAEFYHKYRNFISGIGRSMGLPQDDCDDLIQEVMRKFFNHSGKFVYQPEQGRFHSYLSCIIRRRCLDFLRHGKIEQRHAVPFAEEVLEQVVAPDEFEKQWRQSWEQALLLEAVEVLKERVNSFTWQAFELYVLQERDAAEVAEHLGMSVANVYNCKTRCQQHLKEIIAGLRNE